MQLGANFPKPFMGVGTWGGVGERERIGVRDRIVTDTTQGTVTPTSAVLTAATGISPVPSYHTSLPPH